MVIEKVIIGSVDFLRFKAGTLILGLAAEPSNGVGHKLLCYKKGKQGIFNFYCLRLGDLVEVNVVQSSEVGVCRIKSIILLGLDPGELNARMDTAQERYAQTLDDMEVSNA